MIGICDHNSTENVTCAQKVGQREGLAVIGGMEVTSREEVHILALFNDEQGLSQMADYVYENLPGTNDERAFGAQLVVNEDDEIIGFNQRLLIGATTLSLRQIVDRTHSLDGLAIASHIDREGFGIIGQLGFIPEDLELDGLEISPRIPLGKAKLEFGKDYNLTLVTFSDAHSLEDIGKSHTCFLIKQASIEEIRKALSGKESRRVVT